MTHELPQSDQAPSVIHKVCIFACIVFLVYLLILSVSMVGTGFKWAAGGSEGAKAIFNFATNPFMGLVLGIFATALVQSSSTVTSVIVGLVGGGLPVHTAVPMIMGANIGTTVTNTLVSLGHITRPQEFRRAFAAATIHDMFNFLAVAIFLTIEIITGLLSASGHGFLQMITAPIAHQFAGSADVNVKDLNFIKMLTKPVIHIFHHKVGGLPDNNIGDGLLDSNTGDGLPDNNIGDGLLDSNTGDGLLDNNIGDGLLDGNTGDGLLDGMGQLAGGLSMIAMALIFIFSSILMMGRMLKKNLTGRAERIFHAAVGRGPISGIISGTIVTILVQSSSTTTSLIIPMAGSGVMKLKQIFPFTLGANIGTTVTALIASLSGGKFAEAALHIALIHLFFNIFATILIYGTPFLRAIPLRGSEWLADLAVRKRMLAIAYVVVLYFLLPLIILLCVQLFSEGTPDLVTATTPSDSITLPPAHTPVTPTPSSVAPSVPAPTP